MSFSSTSESIPDTAPGRLLLVARTVLLQAVDILTTQLPSDAQLVTPSKYIPGSTIGKHLRHATDHFQLLLECVSKKPPHILSFDVRVRGTPMETSHSVAIETLRSIVGQLDNIVPRVELNAPITLNAVTPFEQILETTFGRELWFCVLHALHHWALIKVIAGEINVELPSDFGYAPSTLLYQERVAPLGKAKI